MPSVMRLVGALGGLADEEIRATFNGGIGMAVVVPPVAIDVALAAMREQGIGAEVIGEVVPVGRLGGSRYAEGAIT
jgi:phosphoribosylaminoimidazole (AIR) synthetase